VFKGYWLKLLDKVKQGATLYISLDDAYLPSFTEPLGITISTNIKRRGMLKYLSKLPSGDSLNFISTAERKYIIQAQSSRLLATEPDGNPALLESTYGRGKIYLLTFPLELNLAKTTGAFDKGQPLYNAIYKQIAASLIHERVITQPNPYVGATEHPLNDKEKVVVLINYNPDDASVPVTLKDGWHINNSLYGALPTAGQLKIKGNDAVVLIVKK